MQGQELLKCRSSAHVRRAWYPFQITAALGHTSQAAKLRKPMSNDASLVESLRLFTHHGADVQEQRHGSLAATNIPPTPETCTLGPRVEHLSAAADSGLKSTIANQLKLPEVSGMLSLPERQDRFQLSLLVCLNLPAEFPWLDAAMKLIRQYTLVSCCVSVACSGLFTSCCALGLFIGALSLQLYLQ